MDQPVKTFPSEEVNPSRWIGRIIIGVLLGEALWGLIVSVMNNVVVPWLGDVMGQSSGLPTSFTQRPYDYPNLFVSIFEACNAGLVAAVLNYFFRKPSRGRSQKIRTVVQAASAEPTRTLPRAETSPAPILLTPPRASQTQESPSSLGVREERPDLDVTPAPAVRSSVVPSEDPVVAPEPVAVAPAAPAPTSVPIPPPRPTPVAPAAAPVPSPVAAKPPSPSPKAVPAKPKKPKEIYYNIVGEPMASDDD